MFPGAVALQTLGPQTVDSLPRPMRHPPIKAKHAPEKSPIQPWVAQNHHTLGSPGARVSMDMGRTSRIPRTAKEPGKPHSNDHHPLVCSTRYARAAQTTAKPPSPPRSLVRHCRRRQPRAAPEDTKAQGYVTGQGHKARKGQAGLCTQVLTPLKLPPSIFRKIYIYIHTL